MRKLPIIAAVGALALGGAGMALAQHRGGADFERADLDGDGVITLAEAKTHAAERFAQMDADGSGTLTPEDRDALADQRFAEADTDGDGEITPAEMTAAREAREAYRMERRAQRQAAMFERLDADGSGGLSKAELESVKELRGERWITRGGGRGGERDGAGRGNRAMRMLAQADTNNDQAVSRSEFDAMVEARFAKVDTDGSGSITQAERDAAKEARRAKRGERRSRPS